MGSVYDKRVNAGSHECLRTLHAVGRNADAQRVLAAVGLVLSLGNVLVCHQPHEVSLRVNDRQLLYLMLLQYVGGLFQVG